MTTAIHAVTRTRWKGRGAWHVSNGVLQATVLEGGGHIAALRSVESEPSINLLWEAPWHTIDPRNYDPVSQDGDYGPAVVGRFLSGFTGHSLCLDLFGMPSEEEALRGVTLHGEAPAAHWTGDAVDSGFRMKAQLPIAGLSVERDLMLRDTEPILYVSETVTNQRDRERALHWVEHVTLGPPLLVEGESMLAMPAARAKTWPLGYGDKSLVPDNTEFLWPKLGQLDLSCPFIRPGTGMVVAALLDPARGIGYVAALNWRLGLVVGYCFRRQDFPWVAIWEENKARQDAPWNGRTQARGVEFGTTPMPLGKSAIFEAGPLFNTPTWIQLAARARRQTRYAAFVSTVPQRWHELHDLELSSDSILLRGPGTENIEIKAAGIRAWVE